MTYERRVMLETKRKLGYDALGVMERHLKDRAFFVGDHYSIADIALYAYTHVADEVRAATPFRVKCNPYFGRGIRPGPIRSHSRLARTSEGAARSHPDNPSLIRQTRPFSTCSQKEGPVWR
jgi:glutathione S-transferase